MNIRLWKISNGEIMITQKITEKEDTQLSAQKINMVDLSKKLDEKMDEYKRFVFKDNFVKMAIAFVMAGALTKLFSALSENLLMPTIKWALAFAGTTWRDIVWIPISGITVETGKLMAAGLDFVITSMTLFLLWQILSYFRIVNKDDLLKKKDE